MPGFRRSPLDDIQRIRQDLRDRYQDGFPILKELLQNADDAGAEETDGAASQLVLVLAQNGLPKAGHPLLQTAGLAVLNDGTFTANHAISITSLGMSNKASQVGAAGRFGLGLKSVFHWAEAFFYFSPHTFPADSGHQAAACDLLNPWWGRETADGRHRCWEDDWTQSRGADCAAFEQLAQQALNGGRWFGLWLPLRRPEHLRDGKGDIKPIEQRFPAADLDELLGQAWRTCLAETMPLLRRLRSVRACELGAHGLSERARFDVAANAQRMRFGLKGAASAAASGQTLSGTIQSGDALGPACAFTGIEQVNSLASLQAIKCQPWPNQTDIGEDGADRQVPEKAEPHGAVVFTRQPADAKGRLRLQHAVFLPLGELEEIPCNSQWRYCLHLHGFFFVDSGRRHIQAFDDLPDDITPDQADTELKVIKLWNRTLLSEVVAPLVLPSLDAFVKQEQMAAEEVESLVGAMRKSEILKPLLQWMCRGQRFVFRLRSGGGVWEHETWDTDTGQPRRWLALPKPTFAENEFLELLPTLKDLSGQASVSLEGKPFLAAAKPAQPDDSDLAGLLASVTVGSIENAAHLDFLLKLIPEDSAKREPDSGLIKAIVRLANKLISRPLPEDDDLARKWEQFFQRLPVGAFIRLPFKSSEPDPAIKKVLGSHDSSVALLWEDWREAAGSGVIPWADSVPIMQGLGALVLGEEKAIKQRSDMAVRLLQACKEQTGTWPHATSLGCRCLPSAPLVPRAWPQAAQTCGRHRLRGGCSPAATFGRQTSRRLRRK